eukprot:5281328-Pyramimonas_sp.AAC.1
MIPLLLPKDTNEIEIRLEGIILALISKHVWQVVALVEQQRDRARGGMEAASELSQQLQAGVDQLAEELRGALKKERSERLKGEQNQQAAARKVRPSLS